MDDFHGTLGIGGNGNERESAEREQRSNGNDSSETRNRIHLRDTFLVVMHASLVLALHRILNRGWARAGNEGMRECHHAVTKPSF
ncbi:hypothetical protein PCL1606_15610 [Pseudomonas chlororaphis]|uniref:Uncharacterized protein n=1 Tax=Pseudomonas chlororaphis TaxID=587753 RepID=A0A0D5XV79_9PSED|nr:hypothetical protein PCL1606_15610 [Pseudomonas chlororaphis]